MVWNRFNISNKGLVRRSIFIDKIFFLVVVRSLGTYYIKKCYFLKVGYRELLIICGRKMLEG